MWPSFYHTAATSNNTLVGQVRYNGSNQYLEVYDGTTWIPLNSTYPQISLDNNMLAVMAWAQNKMIEEQQLKDLAAKHPTVADALDAVKKAQEQLQMATILCETDSK
jgi:hypothetical protein